MKEEFKLTPREERIENAAIREEVRLITESLCCGSVKCVRCGRNYGCCSEVEYNLTEEDETMIPRGTNSRQQQSGGGGTKRQQGYDYARYDSPWLTYDEQTAKIQEVKINPQVEGRQNYSDVVVKFTVGGKPHLLGLRVGNPELDKLTDAFGDNENQWVGREFAIYLEEDVFDGKKWVRVRPLNEGERSEEHQTRTRKTRATQS